jgi:hypothetical protein
MISLISTADRSLEARRSATEALITAASLPLVVLSGGVPAPSGTLGCRAERKREPAIAPCARAFSVKPVGQAETLEDIGGEALSGGPARVRGDKGRDLGCLGALQGEHVE